MTEMAKYMQIYMDIREKINQNHYEINEKLPDGNSLAAHYQCSKLTVKKALDMLVQEGMIIRRRGSGTFVKSHAPNANEFILSPLAGLADTVGSDHIHSTVAVFSIEKPSAEIAQKLEIEDAYIYRIVRVREVDHRPYSIEHTFMPLSIIPGLEPKHLEGSVYNYIRETLHLRIKSNHVWIRGDRSNAEDSKLLNLKEPTFMMEIEKVGHLEDGRVFEYSITRHTYETFVFETVFVQNQ